jgi:transcriptional antiterminator RfaH
VPVSASPPAPDAAAVPPSAAWYVAHTKPRLEHVALEQLQRQDFEVYLPMFRVFKKPARRPTPVRGRASGGGLEGGAGVPPQAMRVVHEPMFPRYLFLRPTRATQSLSVVRSTLGVSRLVMFGQQPATLADAAIAAIRQAEGLRETAGLDQISPYQPGMAVRLLDPAFSGLQALVQAVSKDRVTLLLEILGRPQSVQVEFARIAPL